MEAAPEYLHDAIDADNQIRLLRSEKNGSIHGIAFRLETFSWTNTPPYNALSYVWGKPEKIHQIELEGKTHLVTSNLYVALKELNSKKKHDTYFWIDQVCINQDDINERNRQVARMKDIYAKAERVIVWVGSEDEDTALAMKYLQKLHDPETLKEYQWYDDHQILSLPSLMNRAWFSRRWVVQEIAFAKEVVLRCGTHEVDFNDFLDAVEILEPYLDDIKDHFNEFPFKDIYRNLVSALQLSGAVPLLRALNSLRLRSRYGRMFCPTANLTSVVTTLTHFRGSDPKDAIYAVRSLASIEQDMSNIPSLEPEYSKSVLAVYTDFVTHCVKTSKSLDIILRPWAPIERKKGEIKILDPYLVCNVPSWIAVQSDLPYGDPKLDLRVRQNADSLLGPVTRPNFNSHGSRLANVTVGMKDATGKQTGSLFAQGIVLGTIERTSTPMAKGIVSENALELLGGRERSVNGDLTSVDYPAWKILCGNIGQAGVPAPAQYRIALKSLLQTNSSVYSIDTDNLLRDGPSPLYKFEKDFLAQVQAMCWNRRIIRARRIDASVNDLVGLGPCATNPGDKLVILYGCSVPVVMRAHQNASGGTQWELVGEAYVQNQMNGEVLYSMTAEELGTAERTFEIR